MKAGNELDQLIAENVMNWELWNGQWSDKETKIMTFIDASRFCPSINIQDAWLVVENNHYDVEIIKTDSGYICKMWISKNHMGEGVYEEIEASTAPLAICLAALKVKGIK